MTDYLELPAFLDLRNPENLAAWKEARRDWKPGKAIKEARLKVHRDAQGRMLPRSMAPEAWAMLRAMEREQEREKRERLAALKAHKRERRTK